jgi:hypothetical protein
MARTDPAGVSCLLQLLHMQLASALQAEHSRLKGRSAIAAPATTETNNSRSSSSRGCSSGSKPQGLQVPCYHEQYLISIGAPTSKIEARSPVAPLSATPFVSMLHREAMQACYQRSGQATTTSSSSSSSSSPLALSPPRQQQQQTLTAADWHQLGEAAVVPMPEQLLMVLEAALIGHPGFITQALDLFTATATALQHHGCLNAAGSVLLPPVLHLLSLALQHALQHPQWLETDDYALPGLCDDLMAKYAALVAILLQAAGATGY